MRAEDVRKAEVMFDDDTHHSVETLSKTIGYSPAHLRRVFKQQFGVSPAKYRSTRKLEQAALLLRYTSDKVSAIASQTSHGSPAIFTRAFCGHYQMSPSAYRRAHATGGGCQHSNSLTVNIGHELPRTFLVTRAYGSEILPEVAKGWHYFCQRSRMTREAHAHARPAILFRDHPVTTPRERLRVE